MYAMSILMLVQCILKPKWVWSQNNKRYEKYLIWLYGLSVCE